jgi:hypothetical protein
MADISTNEIEASDASGWNKFGQFMGDLSFGVLDAYVEVETEKNKAKAAASTSATNTANPANTITEAQQVAAAAPGQTVSVDKQQLIKYGAIGAAVLFIIILVVWGMRKGGKK